MRWAQSNDDTDLIQLRRQGDRVAPRGEDKIKKVRRLSGAEGEDKSVGKMKAIPDIYTIDTWNMHARDIWWDTSLKDGKVTRKRMSET